MQHRVIIKLIGQLQLLRTLSKPKLINYITATSRNTALNHLRSVKKIAEVPYDDSIEDVRRHLPEIDEMMLYGELRDSVYSAWDNLDERNRRVLELKYVLKKPNEQIAKELGIRADSVRMVLSRARNSLKAMMDI